MKLDMVGIIVKDMTKAIAFYTLLDFTVREHYGEYVELHNDGVRLSLNTQHMITQVYGFEPQLKGERIELAFLCDTAQQVDHYCNILHEAGHKIVKAPWLAPWQQYYAIVQDVDGNLISLFATI